MAKNILINGNTYNACPYISVPLSGESGNAAFYDTSDADATAAHVLTGHSAYGASGKVNGQLTVPTVTQDSTTKVVTIS